MQVFSDTCMSDCRKRHASRAGLGSLLNAWHQQRSAARPSPQTILCFSVIIKMHWFTRLVHLCRLVKEGAGQVTLAIGDGANDVSMIQAAHVGVGISGQEGLQAVMAADFALAQFRSSELAVRMHQSQSHIPHTLNRFARPSRCLSRRHHLAGH